MSGLSYMSVSCLLYILDTGYILVPEPPASIIPFIDGIFQIAPFLSTTDLKVSKSILRYPL